MSIQTEDRQTVDVVMAYATAEIDRAYCDTSLNVLREFALGMVKTMLEAGQMSEFVASSCRAEINAAARKRADQFRFMRAQANARGDYRFAGVRS